MPIHDEKSHCEMFQQLHYMLTGIFGQSRKKAISFKNTSFF